MKKTNSDYRHCGIDLLRIISMMMITALHVLGHGGIIASAPQLTLHSELVWLLEILTACSVNCYALISGYVNYAKRHRLSNIIYLNFQVLFYTLAVTVATSLYRMQIPIKAIILDAVFPVPYRTYWYFSSYFCLFFFMPFLDRLTAVLDRGSLKRLIIVSIVLFSVIPTVFVYDSFVGAYGYSTAWLAVLYVIGAYFKKYGSPFSQKNYKNLLLYFLFALLTLMLKMTFDVILLCFGKNIHNGYTLSYYTAPFIVCCAVFLFSFFSNLKIKKPFMPIVRFFAPLTFGVYLLQDEPIIRINIITNTFYAIAYHSLPIMLAEIVAVVLGIWLVCSLVDWIRLLLFKLLHIRELSIYIENKFRQLFRAVSNRFDFLRI